MNPDKKKSSNIQHDDNANPKKKSRRKSRKTPEKELPKSVKDNKDEEMNDVKVEMDIDRNRNPPETPEEADDCDNVMQVDSAEAPEEIPHRSDGSSSSDESSNVADDKKTPYVFHSTSSSEDESAEIIANYWKKRKENELKKDKNE